MYTFYTAACYLVDPWRFIRRRHTCTHTFSTPCRINCNSTGLSTSRSDQSRRKAIALPTRCMGTTTDLLNGLLTEILPWTPHHLRLFELLFFWSGNPAGGRQQGKMVFSSHYVYVLNTRVKIMGRGVWSRGEVRNN